MAGARSGGLPGEQRAPPGAVLSARWLPSISPPWLIDPANGSEQSNEGS